MDKMLGIHVPPNISGDYQKLQSVTGLNLKKI